MKETISMSRHIKPAVKKRDRSTIYGVFAILALLPTAFEVAYQYSATGITSGRPWLVSLFPFVLLVAMRFVPTVWHWSIVARGMLVAVGAVASGLFAVHLYGFLGFLGVSSAARYGVPLAISMMYSLFGLAVGHAIDRASRHAPHPGNTMPHRADDEPQSPVAHVGRKW
jgi:hypothetical protein